MNEKTEQQERAAFEAWFEADALPLEHSNWFRRDSDGDYEIDYVGWVWKGWQARAASPSSKSTKELSDEEVVALCKSAGIGWCEPDEDPEGFPGSFDMATMSEMRALLALASSSIKEDGERAARLLTEDELLTAIQSCGGEVQGRIALTHESGPYSIDRTTVVCDSLARAIQQKFMEVNSLSSSPPSPLGDTPDQQEKKR